MPTDTISLSKAITGFMLDNWTLTPFAIKGTEGFDLSGQHTGNLNDLGVDFIEFDFNNTSRSPAGISRDSGSRALGFLDIQIYTAVGQGNMKLAEIEHQLFTLLERKTIDTAQIRTALNVGRPYEFRGKLTKTVSFPLEYFQS
jgi:hypothetical protein